jgi:hypothetical protein
MEATMENTHSTSRQSIHAAIERSTSRQGTPVPQLEWPINLFDSIDPDATNIFGLDAGSEILSSGS